MNKLLKRAITCILCLLLPFILSAQIESFWTDIKPGSVVSKRYAMPDKYRLIHLDLNALKQVLLITPMEASKGVKRGLIITLPLSDGKVGRFEIFESPIMEPALATEYPDFRTYSGQGIDDPSSLIKISITDLGLHAMVLSAEGSFYIDPYEQFKTENYICYDKKDLTARQFICEGVDKMKGLVEETPASSLSRSHGTQLRIYRLAIAATGEYTTFYGGTIPGALSGIIATMNRVNGIYEKEVAVRMTLIGNNSSIIYTNGATDPYTNNNGGTMLGENQSNIDLVIGNGNYDIGHVFSTGGGGVASLGVPCRTSLKARGVTGSSSPVGDAYDVDYVAHEIGHQFGANHTFNSVTSNCGGGNRNGTTAYEPGSGITIMAYAGICGADNLAAHSIAYFHTISFDEITTYITGTNGNSCPAFVATGNTPPVVNPGGDYYIPVLTPFVLTGSANDTNNDPLTYSWEEFDLGPGGAWNAAQTGTDVPLFRPFEPSTLPSRTFPKLSDIINNTTTIGEVLPSVARTLDFRLTVRDNRVGGGGVTHNDVTVKVNVIATGAPFAVTSPNTAVSYLGGSQQNVTWNVAGTTASPISCANVKISLSTDGGNTFPIILKASTSNDGTDTITLPNLSTTMARVKVEADGNIFFDMSNTNFNIQASSPVLTVITTSGFGSPDHCEGNSFNVSYTIDGPANAGNVFNVQLSDQAGSFSNPVIIGSLNSTSNGTIPCTISMGTLQGTGYRVRVVSTNPVVIGSNNGSNFSISQNIGAAGSLTGSNFVCQGQSSVSYSITPLLNATTYSWSLPAGATIIGLNSSNSVTVDYAINAASGNITVSGTNAGCDDGASSTLPVIVNTLPAAPGAISGTSVVCNSQGGYIYSISAVPGATSYSWTMPSGASITSGLNSNVVTVSFSPSAISGNISVYSQNSCGNSSAGSAFPVQVYSAPATPVLTANGSVTFCEPDSVNLSYTPLQGQHYQWRRNGINLLPVDTLPNYIATVTGNYDVITSFLPVPSQAHFTTTPVTILDNSCLTPSSNITVSGYLTTIPSGPIAISINVFHTWVGDLILMLQAPNGQTLGLSNRTGATGNSGNNFTNTVFTDAGATQVPTTGAPYTATYKPWTTSISSCTVPSTITKFADFGGGSINPNGIWKLLVFDVASQDVGVINSWSITFPAYTSNCNSYSNSISVVVDPVPVIQNFTPATDTTGATVMINGAGFANATSVLFNNVSSSFSILSDSVINAIVPQGAGQGLISVINNCGSSLSNDTFVTLAFATLDVNMFIEGFYNGGGTMTATAGAYADTLSIQLRDTANTGNVLFNASSVLSVNGKASFTLPYSVVGKSYYIVIRHRNSIETWSKFPHAFSSYSVLDLKN